MKKLAWLGLAAALCLTAACASTAYNVKTTTGQTYLAPEGITYQGEKKMFYFNNQKGKKVMMPSFSVSEIQPAE